MQRAMFHSLDCDQAKARFSLLVLSAFFVAHFADFEHVALIDLVQQFPKPRIPKQSMECLHARKRTVRDLRYIAREMTLVLLVVFLDGRGRPAFSSPLRPAMPAAADVAG